MYYQIIPLYTLKLYSVICQLYLIKVEGKNVEFLGKDIPSYSGLRVILRLFSKY